MRDSILMQKELPKGKWLHGMDVLDVGCGGGIFAEVRSVTLLQIFECFFAESVKLRVRPVYCQIRREYTSDRCFTI